MTLAHIQRGRGFMISLGENSPMHIAASARILLPAGWARNAVRLGHSPRPCCRTLSPSNTRAFGALWAWTALPSDEGLMAVCGHLRPTIWRRAMPYRLGGRLGVNLRQNWSPRLSATRYRPGAINVVILSEYMASCASDSCRMSRARCRV